MRAKRYLLIPVLLAFLFIVLQFSSFLENVLLYASGAVIPTVFQNRWDLALLSVIVFLFFLIPLSFRKKADWKQKGLFSAFFISLFIEMYGIPLSIFAAFSIFNPSALVQKAVSRKIFLSVDFLGTTLSMDYWTVFGYIVVLVGAIIISVAWWKLYHSKDDFEKSGIYSISRHPQYLGFFFLIWGWVISWPSILSIVMGIILTVAYHYAAVKEEGLLKKEFGERFTQYAKNTPMYA